MAYLWPQSLVPWLDPCGDPYSGAKAYFFNAGTTTPKTTYTDSGMSIPHDHPVVSSGNGRFPAIFITGGNYRVRIGTADGVTIEDVDGISIPDIGGGGGSGGDTPQDERWQTGDIKARYDIGAHPGFVRANGRSIGNGLSGATERANDDTEALYTLLWSVDPSLAVAGGRGASAASDFAANKSLTLPNFRGRAIFGLCGMGSTIQNVIRNSLVDGEGTNNTLGATFGSDMVALSLAEIPPHNHPGVAQNSGGHRHGVPAENASGGVGSRLTRSGSGGSNVGTVNTTEAGSHTHPVTTENRGDGEAHNNMPPGVFATLYIKL